ncbi:hypothetical protein HPP92_008743 [Vanilla planifolia]|uniref:Uncharacterized protein n=1 Tax=Vanilla planifolia TaxID=51239 RepID=A0A835R9D2_VANPL|nr:hypothetical protein HPP92_008743 [Vanilla planifolia]
MTGPWRRRAQLVDRGGDENTRFFHAAGGLSTGPSLLTSSKRPRWLTGGIDEEAGTLLSDLLDLTGRPERLPKLSPTCFSSYSLEVLAGHEQRTSSSSRAELKKRPFSRCRDSAAARSMDFDQILQTLAYHPPEVVDDKRLSQNRVPDFNWARLFFKSKSASLPQPTICD